GAAGGAGDIRHVLGPPFVRLEPVRFERAAGCARVVPGGGVEPPSKAPKARVLPLDDPGPAPDYAAFAGGPTTGSAASNPAASARACPSSRARPITDEPLPLITTPSAPSSSSRRLASPIWGCRAATDRSRSLNKRGPSASASPAVAA